MDIRNSLDGLRSLLGVNPTPQPAPQPKGSAATTGSGFDSDRATFSAAANEVSQAGEGGGHSVCAGSGNIRCACVRCGLQIGRRDVEQRVGPSGSRETRAGPTKHEGRQRGEEREACRSLRRPRRIRSSRS
jgi:hypothetical protein